MMEKCRLVFSGSGGQGVITAAVLLAEAAVIYEGLNAVQTQSYGAAARGGAARSDVIIWDRPIYYPKVIQPNVLVCLTQAAYNKYQPTIRPGGLLVTDSQMVETDRNVDARCIQLPFHDTVTKKLGWPVVLNTCMLGAVMALTEVVSADSLKKIIKARIDEKLRDINLQAMELGMELGRAQSGFVP